MKFLKQEKFKFSMTDFPAEGECHILSGPVSIKMNRGQMGNEWLVKRDVYCFKLTIEDGHRNTIDEALDAISRLPVPYLVGLEIVSGENENGMALYKDLDGADGHGSRDYCNLTGTSLSTLIHELGHAMEQEVRLTTDEDLLERWKNDATDVDEWRVSEYGNLNPWEDMAEFCLVYSVAYQKNILDELQILSPNRYAIWTECICLLNDTLRTPRCSQYLGETDTVTQNNILRKLGCLDETDKPPPSGTAGTTGVVVPTEYEPDKDGSDDSDDDSDDSESETQTHNILLLLVILVVYLILSK